MRKMTWLWAVLLGLCAGAAQAQTVLPCTAGCPARYYWEVQPCNVSTGACARSYLPLPSEFQSSKGMGLNGTYEGVSIEVCAPPGFLLTGTGTLNVYTWYPWLRDDVSAILPVQLDVADVWISSSNAYKLEQDGGVTSGVVTDGGTNTTYNPRCVHWYDLKVGGYSSRRIMVVAKDVAITTGTCNRSDGCPLEVRINALETIR